MSSWIPRTTRSGIEYGGSASHWYWDYPTNPGAYYDPSLGTYDLALPNCTTLAYGRIIENGDPIPISGWHAAQNWHLALANNWTYIPYDFNRVRPGDILEWSGSRNHVAVVEKIENGIIYVSESIYCDDYGVGTGYRSPAVWGNTKQSVNDHGLTYFPNYYYHYGQMSYAYGYNVPPDYILLNPNPHTPDAQFKFFVKKRKTERRRIRYV